MDGQDWPVKLAKGADFYMQPTWHPDGQQIAWIEWNHPQMPWEMSPGRRTDPRDFAWNS